MTIEPWLEDLARSGLVPADVNARKLDNPERAATATPFSVQGYVFPYFDLWGRPTPHYRVRLFDHEPKYKQPKNVPNQVYFPRGFHECAEKSSYILITEGEKKAALANKLGFPCVAFGGVDSWRNRIITLPGDTELNQLKNKVQAKIPPQTGASEDLASPLALGLQELIDYLLKTEKHVIICYDTDAKTGTKPEVQRAAASLAFDLRFRGIPFVRIRQLILPALQDQEKTGLDDFLMYSKDRFNDLVTATLKRRSAFPRHPSIRDYINRRLQSPKLGRKETQQVSMAILSELDAGGLRLRSRQELQTYYFDYQSRRLLKADFNPTMAEITENPFSQYLYRQFGLSKADDRLNQWLGAMFTGEDPVEEVTPFRILARPEVNADQVIYQINDGQYVRISADAPIAELPGIEILDNGEGGVLFEAEQVKPLDADKLLTEYAKVAKQPVPTCWWADTLMDVRLQDKTKQRTIAALLFYMSPWLHRWRGMQLPIEMLLGEPGSGKSTLYELRLEILNGDPKLRNAPQDLKDFHASIASTGGFHVTDNLQLANKDLRQRISDEVCRIITEPNPYVEMRKLYTNTDLLRAPVRCVFGITAIAQPFMNSDIIQRAIIIKLDKAQDMGEDGVITYNSYWKQQQLSRYGGREAWVAHQLYVLHRFFTLVKQKWKHNYAAKHRLIHFEQSMMLMAEVFGIKNEWIPGYIAGMTDRAITEADWAFEGLKAFATYARSNGLASKPITARDIAGWAQANEEYMECDVLVSTRRLGRYIHAHKSQIAGICGIIESAPQNNTQRYKVVPLKDQ